MGNLQRPSCEFTFRAPGQIGSTESVSTPTLPLDQPALVSATPASTNRSAVISANSIIGGGTWTRPRARGPPAADAKYSRFRSSITSCIDCGPCRPPRSPPPQAAPLCLPPHGCPPTPNGPSIVPESQAAIARAEGIVSREIQACKNNAHARTGMTGKYNNHHHVQSFVVGQCHRKYFPLPQTINGFFVAL